jgi:hypothetical protein
VRAGFSGATRRAPSYASHGGDTAHVTGIAPQFLVDDRDRAIAYYLLINRKDRRPRYLTPGQGSFYICAARAIGMRGSSRFFDALIQ